jgi:Domain of unknown function (DUF4333)
VRAVNSPACSSRACFLLAAISLGTPSLVGCGSNSSTMSTAQIEKAITRTILRQRNVQTTAHCPPKVQRKAGVEFTCTAKLEVGSYPIAVTETDSRGRTRFGNTAPLVILNVAKVQRAIESSILSQRHLKSSVTCPAQVLQQARLTFNCTATVNGKRYPFAVTETNSRGHVRYEGLTVKGR